MNNKEKLLILLPILIGLVLVFTYLVSVELKIHTSNKLKGNSNEYVCEERGISMTCQSLSKINSFGNQTRCYLQGEEVNYKICKNGWELRDE